MTDALAIVARVLLYLAITGAIGELGAQWAEGVAWRERLAVHAQRRALSTWVLALVALLMLFATQFIALDLAPSRDDVAMLVRQTAWGRGWTVLVFAAILGLAGAATRLPGRWRAALAVTFAIAMSGVGHAAADDTPVVARAIDSVHVVGVGVWLGTLWCIGRVTSAASWRRLSAIATWAAPVVVISGVGSAWRRVSTAPFATTLASDYGRTLGVKLLLVLAILAFGYAHRRQVAVHRAPSVRSVRLELLLALLVLGATALLTGTAPPGE